jgi:hypothetical protein
MIYEVKVFNGAGTLKKVIPTSKLSWNHDLGNRYGRPTKYTEIVCEVCGVMLKVRDDSQVTCNRPPCKNYRKIKLARITRRTG